MRSRAIGGLAAALVGLAVMVDVTTAAPTTPTELGYVNPWKEFAYTGEVRASYTIDLTDSASGMTGRTSMRIRYSAPLVIHANAREGRIMSDDAPFLRRQPVGTIGLTVTGRNRAGCEFAFDRSAKTRMNVTANAFPQQGSVRLVSKPVRAGYELRLVAYAVGELPKLTTPCNLNERIGPVLDLSGLLQGALWFDRSETAIAGAWPPAYGYAEGAATGWPVLPLLYQQVWPTSPAKRAGVYRFPVPVDRLASGKPLTITKNLARRYPVAGAPSVTIATTGTITFSFKPKR